MADRAVGISTLNANEYVAAIEASEQADGHSRLIQLTAITAGKIDTNIGSPTRTVSVNDSLDVTTVSGNILIGDDSTLSIFVQHSEPDGSCLITPLLCDASGTVIGSLNSKISKVTAELKKDDYYLSPHLSWDIKQTGAHKMYPHIYNLSSSNEIKCWIFLI